METAVLDDLAKEIKAQLYERVKSPLFGAFAFSWVTWNYRTLLALVSDLKLPEKLEFIDKAYPSTRELLWHGVAGPFLCAVIFLLVYPIPARKMYHYWAKQQSALKKIQQKIEDETPLTQEEANAIRKTAMAQSKEYSSQIADLDAAKKELEERMRMMEDENSKLSSKVSSQESLIAHYEDTILNNEEEFKKQVTEAVPDEKISTDLKNMSPLDRKKKSVDNYIKTNSDELKIQLGDIDVVQRTFLSLVALDEAGDEESIAKIAGISKIEVTYSLSALENRSLVVTNGISWQLSEAGRIFAVNQGYSQLSRIQ